MKSVTQLAYHRNGVSGDQFWIALIEDPENTDQVLLGIVPASAAESGKHSSETGLYQCYVVNPQLAVEGNIKFGENSWRGDYYFDLIVEAVRKREERVNA